MMALSRSKPSGMPATLGKRTFTYPGRPVSSALALRPQPSRVSLIASGVKLSPPMRSRAASASRRCRAVWHTGR